MKYKLFTYPVPPPENPEELNAFLSSNRILCVQSHVVIRERIPFLVFIVEYLDSGKGPKSSQARVDYREQLSEENFLIFSQLRDLRKTIAEKEGVPVFAVFTNAQLAQMVEIQIKNVETLLSIPGIGRSKREKYGKAFVDICCDVFEHNSQPGCQGDPE